MVFYVDTVYIAKSFLAYSTSFPSFFGLGVGASIPTFGTPHTSWSGWALRSIKHQTSNITPSELTCVVHFLGTCRSLLVVHPLGTCFSLPWSLTTLFRENVS